MLNLIFKDFQNKADKKTKRTMLNQTVIQLCDVFGTLALCCLVK
jgi:hypothetical protein